MSDRSDYTMLDRADYATAAYCRVANIPETHTALYCRTATKTKDGFAIEAQKDRLLRYADENSHTNTALYIDDGESGATLDRPAMKRLIADIQAGNVKAVIATGADRITRGIEPMLEWERLLRENDVVCVTLECGNLDLGSGLANMSDLMRLLSSK